MVGTWLDTVRLARRRHRHRVRWAELSRPGIQFIDLPSATVRVRIAGKGPETVVLTPDPPNVIEHYDRLFELLSPKRRVVCFEAPGFGFSFPKRRFDFGLDDYARAVGQLLRTLDLGPVVLAFSCVAAYVALRVASWDPRQVKGLLLMQAPSWSEEAKWVKRIDIKGLIQTPVVGQLFMAALEDRVVKRWYPAALAEGRAADPFLTVTNEALSHGASFCLASTFQRVFLGDRPHFGPVKQPVHLLWGTADRTHRRTDRESLRLKLDGAGWHEFEDAGHFPDLETPERFVELVEQVF